MKLTLAIVCSLFLITQFAFAQERNWQNPIIKGYGQILDLEKVDVKPDPNMEYKILIELVFDMDKPERTNFSATNVARLINLHAIGGVKKENLNVAVVIHAAATNTVINNEAYQKKYETDNPYLDLYKELSEAGVELIVCGQSLMMYRNDAKDVVPQVKIATSALTAVSTYQLKGFAYFKWD
jgi:intracellular sulfur oxidation DsrE/DsrF family protein